MGKIREWTGAKDARSASRDATRAQVNAGKDAIESQEKALKQIRGDLAPFRTAGKNSLSDLQGILNFSPDTDPSRVLNNPLFQALAGQQEQRLMNSAAARGKLGSGGTNDDLMRNLLLLGNDFSQQDLQNQMGIQNQNFNQLFNTSTMGANAAAQTGTATQNTAGNVGDILQGIGNAQSAGITNRGNIMAQSRQDMLTNFGNGGLLGAMSGGAISPSTNMGQGLMSALSLSDERLKENKKAVGVDDDGLTVYEFNYRNDPTVYIGKMAQDIQEIDPDAVIENDEGFLMVTAKYAPEVKGAV